MKIKMKIVKNARQQIFIFEKLFESVMLLPIHFIFSRNDLQLISQLLE